MYALGGQIGNPSCNLWNGIWVNQVLLAFPYLTNLSTEYSQIKFSMHRLKLFLVNTFQLHCRYELYQFGLVQIWLELQEVFHRCTTSLYHFGLWHPCNLLYESSLCMIYGGLVQFRWEIFIAIGCTNHTHSFTKVIYQAHPTLNHFWTLPYFLCFSVLRPLQSAGPCYLCTIAHKSSLSMPPIR